MSDKKPRGVVGRLLQKITGGKTQPTPTKATAAQGPRDPGCAMVLFTRLRDAGMVAERDHLSLDGNLPARRKAIVTELEADRYDQAEQLLQALDEDYEKERAEQRRATEQLKSDFAGIKQRAAEAARSRSTSPAIAEALRKTVRIEQAILDQVKAKEVIKAARLLASFDEAVKAVGLLEKADADQFELEWKKVGVELGKLTAAVIGPELAMVRNDEVNPAKGKADGGDPYAGLKLLATALASCVRLTQLTQAYDRALQEAKDLLASRKAEMLSMDVEQVQKDLIDAAENQAKSGQRQAAMALLAQVASRCAEGKTTRDTAPSWKDQLEQKMADLLTHAHRAALAADIDRLNVRFERAKANQRQGLTKAIQALYSEIYWECDRLAKLATAHGGYVQQRDGDVKPRVAALRTDEPVSAVVVLEAEIKAAEEALARADRKAEKHQYETATEALAQVRLQCEAVAQLKRDQAAYAVLFKDVSDLLTPMPDAKGTPMEAPISALRVRLVQAQQQAMTQRQFALASQALTALKADVQAVSRRHEGVQAAGNEATQARPAGNDAEAARASLLKVRQLLDRLKQHAGHPGAKAQIDQMSTLLQQAEAALKD